MNSIYFNEETKQIEKFTLQESEDEDEDEEKGFDVTKNGKTFYMFLSVLLEELFPYCILSREAQNLTQTKIYGENLFEVKHFYKDITNRSGGVDRSSNSAAAIYYHHYGHDVFTLQKSNAIHYLVNDKLEPLFDNHDGKTISFDKLKEFLDNLTFPWPNERSNIIKIRQFYNTHFEDEQIPEVYNLIE